MSVRLTKRQEECLRLSVTMTDKEIARTLGISANTVDKHIREATRRLGVSRRKEARTVIRYAVGNGTRRPWLVQPRSAGFDAHSAAWSCSPSQGP